jgi:hypothetical protein
MNLNFIATALAAAAAISLLAVPADAASKQRRVVASRGHTVYVSRDEDGRTRTKIIVQKRSYLNPGTEQFPGERSVHEYAVTPTHHASSVLDHTIASGDMSPLPGPFTLPSRNNPWIGY